MLNEQRTKRAAKVSSPIIHKPPESKTLPDIKTTPENISMKAVTKPNSEGLIYFLFVAIRIFCRKIFFSQDISCATYRSDKTNPKLSRRDKYLQVYGNKFVQKLGFTVKNLFLIRIVFFKILNCFIEH